MFGKLPLKLSELLCSERRLSGGATNIRNRATQVLRSTITGAEVTLRERRGDAIPIIAPAPSSVRRFVRVIPRRAGAAIGERVGRTIPAGILWAQPKRVRTIESRGVSGAARAGDCRIRARR